MKIAHFSDLHLCEEAGGKAQLEKTLEWVEEAATLGAEHLVFTGDLVDYANVEDAKELFRRVARLGYRTGNDVTVVPGNHDIFPIGHFASTTGDAQENFRSFERLTRSYRRTSERVWSNYSWPFVRQLGDDVVLVGLDTTHTGRLGRLRSGVGELQEADVAAILEKLEGEFPDCERRILAMHHWPFAWNADSPSWVPSLLDWAHDAVVDVNFEDLPAVRRFIRAGRFDVVLCGHQHGFEVAKLGSARVVRSACEWYETEDDEIGFEVGFHLIDLDGHIEITEHGECGEIE